MAEKATDKNIVEIKKLLKAKGITIGTEKALKGLKLGKISKIYLSSNCSDKTLESIDQYAKLSKAEIVKLDYPNDELGLLCKKPFSISVLSVPK
jgi:large subunit ribosomal protein L30e